MARWFVDRLPERGIPSVSLRRLLPGAQFVGAADWEVSGCCDDHRRLDPGQLFVAVPEARPGYDGHCFVSEALERGAAGVVVEHVCPEAGRLQVVVADARAAHARICQALSGDPSQVFEGQNFAVRIDEAQTPIALERALAALRSIASTGRVHCVLSSEGCGERAARRRLAAIAEMRADRVILTLGNPRTEDPGQILSDLLGGFHQPSKVLVEADRRAAIETALADARCGDAVLIAGKGRHSVQIFADRVIPFDDNAVTTQWLRSRRLNSIHRSA
jgi:UDP-N-acetylmuramyl tripeptide synthase